MAISPNQVYNAAAEADAIEARIDQYLRTHRTTSGSSICISGLYAEGQVLQILRQRYRAAGWADLKANSDTRDGKDITLYPPRNIQLESSALSCWDR